MKRLTLLLLSSLLAAGAWAQENPPIKAPHEGGQFARLDVNKDGKLSPQEVADRKAIAQNFDKIDANHDGSLSPQELHAARQQSKAQRAQKSASQTQPAGS